MRPKERLAIEPVMMSEQPPRRRVGNQQEVPLGFTPEQARQEARRCLQCKNAACIKGCPVGVDIPTFLGQVAEGNFAAAVQTIKKTNVLPAICGRVCPQEEQCQQACTVAKYHKTMDKAVSVGKLERFVADWEREQGKAVMPEKAAPTGKKVAVVGSGPAGLTVAGDLAKRGHDVTVFEALHKPGGVLIYGIPEFRLPKAIVQSEVEALQQYGVKFRYNMIIGKTFTLEELRHEFDSVFLGTGAGLPKFMNIPGENLLGVYSANEYLTRANLMRAFDFPRSGTPILRAENVAVIGGGNVAMDAARTALRLGAEKSMIIYRRSRAEMPARQEEIHHAEEEGVEFHLLKNPTQILGADDGWVRGIELLNMELGEPDESGRRRPVAVPGSEHVLDAGVVIIAVGNRPNPLLPRQTPQLQVERWGGVIVDTETCATSMPGVYAGGDIVQGAATVILAMGDGRRAAQAMHEHMTDSTRY